ncbi:MAG: hypothetical protein EPO08_03520 [Rhodospirillaceae bacterium]|nr:MAG: hypothetical protein EPO08_03520 [Rhodospirillaceae bacterium]
MPRKSKRQRKQSPEPSLQEQHLSEAVEQSQLPPSSELNQITQPLPPELSAESDLLTRPGANSNEHLDALATDGGAEQSGGEVIGPAGAVLSREEFRASFVGSFGVGAIFLPALAIAPDETEKAAAAADAIYDSALEVAWLRFLVDPQSKWVPRIIAISVFAIPKGKAVMVAIQEKKKGPRDIDPSAPLSPRQPAAGPFPRDVETPLGG